MSNRPIWVRREELRRQRPGRMLSKQLISSSKEKVSNWFGQSKLNTKGPKNQRLNKSPRKKKPDKKKWGNINGPNQNWTVCNIIKVQAQTRPCITDIKNNS